MTEKKHINKIGIIGGGVVGLSVATILQKRFNDTQIEITAESLQKSTTSWGAPGFLQHDIRENKYEDSQRWYKKGSDNYWEIFRSPDCVNAGVSITNLYYLSDQPITYPKDYGDIYVGFRNVDTKELTALGFSSTIKHAVSYTSTLVESRYYLPYLTNEFINNGGIIINNRINGGKKDVADWALKNEYDIIVNCSGLGSHELFGDESVMPIRGQVVRVEAPWFKHSFCSTNDGSYAFSCRETVVLGGYRQVNDWEKKVRPSETKDILNRIHKHNVALSNSKIIEEWCGLRPGRKNLRLETEIIESSSGNFIPVVHNYGHGASGIGLSWGTSFEAADLVEAIIQNKF